jgi:hypothetical protein
MTRIKRLLPAQKVVSCPSWQGEEPTSDSQVPTHDSRGLYNNFSPCKGSQGIQTADAAAKRKVRDYQRFFDIQQSNRSFSLLKRVGTRQEGKIIREATGETVGRTNGVGYPTHLPDVSCGDSKLSSKLSLSHKKEIRNRHPASTALA